MSNLGRMACVFLSIMGSIYCVWILWDCWRQARAWKMPSEHSCLQPCGNGASKRIEWLCQLLAAGVFLAIAVVLLTANTYQVLLSHVQNRIEGYQQPSSTEIVSTEGLPGVFLDRDSTRPDSPIVGIDCSLKPVSDEQLRTLLRKSPELGYLTLTRTGISDDILRDLSQCPHLRTLNLDHSEITDRGLEHLAAQKSLESLSLVGTKVTDDGLRHLTALAHLKILRLSDTAINDHGLEHLTILKSLEQLTIHGNGIPAHQLRRLAAMRNLKVLLASSTTVVKSVTEHKL